MNKVGQLLWAWFSLPRKSANKISEPRHTANFCPLQLRMILASFTNTQLQYALYRSQNDIGIIIFLHLMNENKYYRVTNILNN